MSQKEISELKTLLNDYRVRELYKQITQNTEAKAQDGGEHA
jgi:hypothetical protein